MDAEDASDLLDSVIRVIGEAVRRFGGVVNKVMGDGIMVLFGAPIAAEDHAARACFAALAALDGVSRMGDVALPVRIGICSGPVILRKTGRDDEDYDVVGVTAHIAARLEQQAEPGAILLAEQTKRLVAGIADVASLGNVALKGFVEPVQVFRLLGAIDRPSWIVRSGAHALSTFVGREQELAQLSMALERAWAGRPQAVALVADAGMGKSRLVHELLSGLGEGAWHIMRVATTAQTSAAPYFLVTALLRELVGCSQADSIAEVTGRLPSVVAALGARVEVDLAPVLVHLDHAADAAGFNVTDPVQRRRRLVQALCPLMRRSAEQHPLVLVIEDYHWLDASSVELLDELFSELKSVRFALLLTTRPERRPGWQRTTRPSDDTDSGELLEIELRQLTPSQGNDLLRELIGASDELAALRAHIIARADGTPFFLEEFARSLQESGVIRDGVTGDGVTGLAAIVIPASVQGILAARIDRLRPLHRRILQLAAVVGRDVPSSLLAAVADLHEASLTEVLTALRMARFLVEDSLPSGIVHRFLHALTQAVAYDTLLRSERRALHERVLRTLEALGPDHRDGSVDHLAHHAARAEAWPEAARYALTAGERASRRSALTEAKAYLETAIASANRQPASVATMTLGIDARLSLRGVYASLNDNSGMQEYLQQYLAEADSLAALAGDRLSLARVYISRGAMLAHWGDLPGATELSRTALDVMLADGDSVGVVSAAFALAQALWYSGDLKEARRVLVSTVSHARSEHGQRRSTATFVLPAAVFFCYLARVETDLGDSAAGFAAMTEARGIATRSGHAFDHVLVDVNEGALLLASEQTAASIAVLERALGVARSHKIEWHIPLVSCVLGRAYVEVGRHGDARTILTSASIVADRNRHVAKRLLCSPPLIRALADETGGDLAAASDLATRTLQEATTRGFRPIVVQTHLALARVLTASQEPAAARTSLKAAAALSRELGMPREELEARHGLASLPQHSPADVA